MQRIKLMQVVIAVLLLNGLFLFGDTSSALNEQKEPSTAQSDDKQSQPETQQATQEKPIASFLNQPVEVLSDTMGVNFNPYLTRVMKYVKQNWYLLIPDSARPPVRKSGEVTIEFAIMKNGKVQVIRVATSSGDAALDRAAFASVKNSQPFPPLPTEFVGDHLSLRFHFYYNPAKQAPTSGIKVSILPVGDVHLTVGSSHVFFANVTGTKNTAVIWSVVGLGCSGAECGTMTDGLYVAPDKLPSPPVVIVRATSQADTSASDTLEVPLSEASHQ